MRGRHKVDSIEIIMKRPFRVSLLIYLGILILFCYTGGTAADPTLANAPDNIRRSVQGIYALGSVGNPFDQEILENPYVDGLTIRIRWKDLEPARDQYDWSFLDLVMEQARAFGKRASVSVAAGKNTPDWVYQSGAQSFTFIDPNPYHKNTFCTELRIPIPYDPIFLREWKDLIQALGLRYKSHPALTKVRISGIDTSSAELILPHSSGKAIPNCDKTSNDIQNWINAGYTATLIKNTWLDIANAFQAAFPDKALSAAFSPNGLPKINDFGQYDAKLRLNEDILNLGRASLGPFFIPQNNGLSARWEYGMVRNAAADGIVGFQMLWFVTGDGTYRMNGRVPGNQQTIFEEAVKRGIDAGGSYLEIYKQDIANPDFQEILKNASIHP